MVLQNYSGDKLRVVRQIKVTVSCSGHSARAIIQVQKGAPAKLLVGTTYCPNWHIILFRCQGKVVTVMYLIMYLMLVYTNQMIEREKG